jgi:hypothetical protein
MANFSTHTQPFKFNSERIAYGFLAIFLAAIPLSKAVASVAEVLVIISWFIGFSDPTIRNRRFDTLKSSAYIFLFPALLLMYFVGLSYTTDMREGWSEINMKHYFFTLPILLGTLRMTRDEWRWLLLAFGLANVAVAVSVFYITAAELDFLKGTPKIPSAFEQRPRASLFLCFSFFIFIEYLVVKWRELSNEARTTLLIFAGMVLAALILMKGRIGQLGFVVLVPAFVMLYVPIRRHKWWWYFGAGFFMVAIAAFMYFSFESVRQPFDEAVNEFRESQLGYPSSEPTYSSIGQRIAFYQEYWPLLRENLWLGVGTGDLVAEGKPLFEDQQYHIPFNKPHNQFLETAIKFGVLGLIYFVAVWFLALKSVFPGSRRLARLFNLLLFLSMLSDSTLGTQAGITFFMAFNALFLVRPDEPLLVQSDKRPEPSTPEKKAISLN